MTRRFVIEFFIAFFERTLNESTYKYVQNEMFTFHERHKIQGLAVV